MVLYAFDVELSVFSIKFDILETIQSSSMCWASLRMQWEEFWLSTCGQFQMNHEFTVYCALKGNVLFLRIFQFILYVYPTEYPVGLFINFSEGWWSHDFKPENCTVSLQWEWMLVISWCKWRSEKILWRLDITYWHEVPVRFTVNNLSWLELWS